VTKKIEPYAPRGTLYDGLSGKKIIDPFIENSRKTMGNQLMRPMTFNNSYQVQVNENDYYGDD